MNRPRLLFLCQTLPYPPDGGVQIRSYNILRLLARAYDVTALFFFRKATRPTQRHVQAGLDGVAAHARSDVFPIPQEHSRIRFLWDHVRSTLAGRAYTYYGYDSAQFTSRVRELLEIAPFDIVHMDSLDLSRYISLFDGLPVACTHHNIESDLLRRRAETEEKALVRQYLLFQSRLMEAEERRWCSRLALNITVSREDARRLKELVPEARVATIPNGVDTGFFQPARSEQGGLVFVGGYGWYPNRDGMTYFVRDILPLIRERRPDVEVTWVGRAPESVREEYQRRFGIRLTGYVEDIRPYVHGAACYIVPLRSGGGTRLKILDAWALGKAVVSTAVGCEGLETEDGGNILIRDEPQAFAAAALKILDDEAVRTQLGRNARRTAEDVYDWDVIGRGLMAAYEAAMAGPGASALT